MSPTDKIIRILLADDHKMFRDGLKSLINAQDDMEIIGATENGRNAVQIAEELTPDVIIMDIGMPDMNGIEATRQIVDKLSHAKVIALSMHTDKRFIVGMFQSGASGYLLKDCAFDELVQAIRTVLSEHVYLSSEIASKVVEDFAQSTPTSANEPLSILTNRERDVLQLLAEGCSTKEIAHERNVSVKTIENYRHKLMRKLSLDSVADLTKFAVREGLTTLEH